MNYKDNFYLNRVVYKPWGYEYVIYNDMSRIAITFVHIRYGHKTSLHCHPRKKTGFIILDGKALVQIGIYKKNSKNFNSLSRLVFRPGLFHSLEAISQKGVYALELETPYNKNDLLRFKDNYGRQSKNYEGKKFTKKISDQKLIKFKKPKLGEKYTYNFNNIEVLLEARKDLKNLLENEDKTTAAILDGNIVDKKNQTVISSGEVVKTSTLRIFYKKFKIKKPITILRVSKKKGKYKKNNKFI